MSRKKKDVDAALMKDKKEANGHCKNNITRKQNSAWIFAGVYSDVGSGTRVKVFLRSSHDTARVPDRSNAALV